MASRSGAVTSTRRRREPFAEEPRRHPQRRVEGRAARWHDLWAPDFGRRFEHHRGGVRDRRALPLIASTHLNNDRRCGEEDRRAIRHSSGGSGSQGRGFELKDRGIVRVDDLHLREDTDLPRLETVKREDERYG